MGAAYRRGPGGHVELGEDALGVGAQRVDRDVELAGDLWSGELAVKKPEHLQFALAQRVRPRSAAARPPRWSTRRAVSRAEEPSGVRLHDGVGRAGSVVQEGQHRGTLVQVQPHMAVRLWRVESFGGVRRAPPEDHRGPGGPGPAASGSPARCRPGPPPPPRRAAGRVDRSLRALTASLLGEQQPNQSQMRVLAQIVRLIIDADPGSSAHAPADDRSPAAIWTRAFIAAMGRTST